MFLSAHFARYFTQNIHHEKGGSEYVFEWSQLKALQKSFLDSIVVELCLPNSRFPDNILHLLLRDAIDEASHKEQCVFPQTLWDAIGDLSVSFSRPGIRPFYRDRLFTSQICVICGGVLGYSRAKRDA